MSIKDVASRAGVSYQTVSKILNGSQIQVLPETAERVWQAARDLGYRPNHNARNLRARRSRMIGYSWEPEKQSNHILDMFLTSMVEEAEAGGYHLLPFPFLQGEKLIAGYRELIDSGRVDGFILSSVNYHDPRAAYLLSRQFPFVGFGRSSPDLDFPWVDVDGGAGIQMATEHLIARGHRRIALLGWPEASRVGNDRLAGYKAALEKAGLPFLDHWVSHTEGTAGHARAVVTEWLLQGPERPTGVVAISDSLAIGAIQAGQAAGLAIGSELAVTGFDDSPMADYLSPSLTSIRQPIRAAGRKCMELLVKLLKGENLSERRILLAPELIVRGSG